MSTPNEVIWNDKMERQTRAIDRLVAIQEALYKATQEEESEKTPKNLRPYTINIVCGSTAPINAIQVLPRNISRHDVAMVNVGPGNLLVCNTWFDPISILQQFSDPTSPDTVLPAPNQMIKIAYVPAGGSLTITSTDALWAYNVESNAVLTMIETVFDKAGPSKSSTMPIPGFDGKIGAGYVPTTDADGNTVVQHKALR